MTTLSEATSKIRARYAEGLPAKWRVVEEALAQLLAKDTAGDREAEDTLRRIAHQVRGSAASFGFAQIDKLASQVEHAGDRTELECAAGGFIDALRAAYEAEVTASIRVLLIDDDPNIGFIMTALLAEGRPQLVQVTTAEAALEELEASAWNIIFVDLVLPDADGRSLLTSLRGAPAHADTPVVVLSAKTSSLVKNECAVYGIDDFIEKPIDPSTFAVRVAALLERAREPQPTVAIDHITGLPNRLGFRRALDRLAPVQRRVLALALVELEHYQSYERERGRKAGEERLLEITAMLRVALRDGDVLGRWGAGEFLLGLPGLHALEASELLARATEAVLAKGWTIADGRPLRLVAGLTELDEREPLDFGLLRADQLLGQVRRKQAPQVWVAHTLESARGDLPKLLVAEDDPAVVALLHHDLSEDFDITAVADGEAALAAASEQLFDLVLLDYQMPHKDGLEVLRALRARPEYDGRPILMLTAVGSDSAVEAAFAAGADDYIGKPYRGRALRARLTRHLGRAPVSRDHAPSRPAPSPAPDAEVTALACRISEFAALADAMPPRELLLLLNHYFPAVAKLVHEHAGKLQKYIGDAVLATWSAAGDHDHDHAARALAAAVEIQAVVDGLSDGSEPGIRVGIGIAGGRTPGAGDALAADDPTTVANRISGLAEPGEIAIAAATVEALGDRSRWPLEGPELVATAGLDEDRLEVYRVRRSSP